MANILKNFPTKKRWEDTIRNIQMRKVILQEYNGVYKDSESN